VATATSRRRLSCGPRLSASASRLPSSSACPAAQVPLPRTCPCPPACLWRTTVTSTHLEPPAHPLLALNCHHSPPDATTHLSLSGVWRRRSSVPATHLCPPVCRRRPPSAARPPVSADSLAYHIHPYALPTGLARSSALVPSFWRTSAASRPRWRRQLSLPPASAVCAGGGGGAPETVQSAGDVGGCGFSLAEALLSPGYFDTHLHLQHRPRVHCFCVGVPPPRRRSSLVCRGPRRLPLSPITPRRRESLLGGRFSLPPVVSHAPRRRSTQLEGHWTLPTATYHTKL